MVGMIDAAQLSHAELEAVLRWYAAMGVDQPLVDAPRNRFAEFEQETARRAAQPAPQPVADAPRRSPVSPLRPPPAPLPPARPAAISAEQAVLKAQETAAAAATLDELRAALEAFDGCGLKRTASKLVFADGNPAARIMLVGEAPGGDEDREGRPFVGRAGRLLDRMLASIGLDREQVYIANVVPWRPPGNRTPTPQEMAVCEPFIRRQIELVNPDHLVCLGAASAAALLGVKEGITRARGRAYEYEIGKGEGARRIHACAMLHPAYLIRQPLHKKLAWADLRTLKKALAPG